MDNPLVSIILPAYNAEKTIKETLDSILSQTYTNWEMLLINDGSKDRTLEIVSSYNDERIRIVNNDGNKGLIYTLNRGIDLAAGKYIARMDSDDIALPTRFEKQVMYLERNPSCVICGSFIQTFYDDKTVGSVIKYETDEPVITKSLIRECCFAHPTVMIRSDIFLKTDKRYDYNFPYAEDYKFWIDLMDLGDYHNIPEVLLKYRISSTQMSQSKERDSGTVNNCRWLYLEKYLGKETADKLKDPQITIDTIKKLNKIDKDVKEIKSVFWLSLNTYSFKELFYYLFSLDAFKLGWATFVRFVKRVIKGKAPIIY